MGKSATNALAALETEGDALVSACDFAGALARYEAVLQRSPRRLRALRGAILCLRKLGRFEEAAGAIARARAGFPKVAGFPVEAGWMAFERGRFEEGLHGFEAALRLSADDVGALQGKAACLRELGRFDAAGAVLEAAIPRHPESLGLATELGWLRRAEGDEAAAAEAFGKALALEQPDDSLFLWRSYLLRRIGRPDEAEAVVERGLQRFPDSIRLRTEHGWVSFQRGDYEDANRRFSAVLAQEPDLATALQGKVAALRKSGALDDADFELAAHRAAVAGNAGLLAESGWVAYAREDFAGAARAFAAVVALSSDPLDRVNQAWALCMQGGEAALRQAAALCRQSLAGHLSAEALGCLGVVAFKLRHIDEAEAALKESIRIDPMRGHHADLAALYLYLMRMDDAEKVLGEAVAAQPNDASVHATLAGLHLQRGEAEKAVRCLRRALRVDPGNVDLSKSLAAALLAAGRAIEAEGVLRPAIARAQGERRANLLLELARVLTRRFDDEADTDLLAGALKAVALSRQLRPATADSFFQEGLVHSRLKRFREARAAFAACERLDPSRVEAGINARRMKLMVAERSAGMRHAEPKSWMLFGFFLLQLALLWYLQIAHKGVVGDATFATLVPICLALMVVAFLIPSLSKFSLTGISVELAEAKKTDEAKGPTGPVDLAGTGSGAGSAM